jgi:hypothetical protein
MTFDHLVRAGKVRYIGFSDVPAWYVTRTHILAEQTGKERVAALQLEYSLVERTRHRARRFRERPPTSRKVGPSCTVANSKILGARHGIQEVDGLTPFRIIDQRPTGERPDTEGQFGEVITLHLNIAQRRERDLQIKKGGVSYPQPIAQSRQPSCAWR